MTNDLEANEYLFSYGTLQLESVQRATFGRTLQGARDTLTGYELSLLKIEDAAVIATSGQAHHSIVSFTGRTADTVKGSVFAITPQELEQADAYEVDDYERIEVVLDSGAHAWVYVQRRPAG